MGGQHTVPRLCAIYGRREWGQREGPTIGPGAVGNGDWSSPCVPESGPTLVRLALSRARGKSMRGCKPAARRRRSDTGERMPVYSRLEGKECIRGALSEGFFTCTPVRIPVE